MKPLFHRVAGTVLICLSVLLFFCFPARGSDRSVPGLDAACAASHILTAAGVSNHLTISDSRQGCDSAACVFSIFGSKWIYEENGGTGSFVGDESRPINVEEGVIARKIADDDDMSMENGCMVHAVAALARRVRDPKTDWAMILGGMIPDPSGSNGVEGHAVLVFKSQNSVYMQENGGPAVRLIHLTHLMQKHVSIPEASYFSSWYSPVGPVNALVVYDPHGERPGEMTAATSPFATPNSSLATVP